MKKCAFCQIEIECTSNKACWCYSLPHIPLEIDEQSCLCKACLLSEMAKCINNKKLKLNNEQLSQIALLGPSNPPRESIDYYMNSDGLLVFTKWYHLKRGFCCENKCQNCPYN